MSNQLAVGVIGGLGLMASPMARHWNASGPARVIRVLDRGTISERHDRCRQAWRDHGAQLVADIPELVGKGDLDGFFICAGKNGDDIPIISKLIDSLPKEGRRPFICHMSTVSAEFALAAASYCERHDVDYVSYPLTGGPVGAEKGTMLILASGSAAVYERLLPALQKLGSPRYFGESISAGSEVKLMGQMMVFNGLIGICSAAALHSECFQDGTIGGKSQAEFFDFLNGGAGGTKQWEVILSAGIRNDIWDAPFFLSYASIDAIYAAQLAISRGLSCLAVKPMIDVALAFSYVLNEIDSRLATHAIVREMVASRADELDRFIVEHSGPLTDLRQCLRKCIESLPANLKVKVALDVAAQHFETDV